MWFLLLALSAMGARNQTSTDFKILTSIFYDGNIAQKTFFDQENTTEEAGGEDGLESATDDPSLGQAGKVGRVFEGYGSEVEINIGRSFLKTKENTFSIYLNGYSSFFDKYTAYDYERARLTIDYETQSEFKKRSYEIKYVNTFYQGVYNQDYLKFSYNTKWLKQDPEPQIELLISKYIRTHESSFFLHMDMSEKWRFVGGSFSLGFVIIKGFGDKAVFTSSGANTTWQSGEIATRYNAGQAYMEVTAAIADRWELRLEGGITRTLYDKEDLPSDSGAGIATEARDETLSSVELALKYTVPQTGLATALVLNYDSNWASGFQGLLTTANRVPSASYNHPVVFVKLSYEY